MGRINELISAEFARWEQRGRGWRVWPEPVQPEPAFEEFTGYQLDRSQPERKADFAEGDSRESQHRGEEPGTWGGEPDVLPCEKIVAAGVVWIVPPLGPTLRAAAR